MKVRIATPTTLALTAAAMLAFAINSVTLKCEAKGGIGQEAAAAVEVDAVTASASVLAINFPNRTITLVMPDGSKQQYKVSKEVNNFDQINVGDKVNTTVVEALAVYLRPSSAPASAGEAETVSLAPKAKGAEPGVITTDTKELTAKVQAVNRKNHTVTLKFVDGSSRTVRVNKTVDLTGVKPGDDVTVRLTDALAVMVQKG
jgi:hypothetical protein